MIGGKKVEFHEDILLMDKFPRAVQNLCIYLSYDKDEAA